MKMFISVFLLLASVGALAGRAEAQVIVIANQSVKSDAVSKNDLREVFLGNSTNLKDGSRVKPVLLKEGAIHAEFLSNVMGKSPTGFMVAWRGVVMSGQSTMPKAFDSETAMVDYVSHTAGAVGYIGKATPHGGVKVIDVH
jgi:hypothetical protein